ncbi:DMT family transporter, partial [Klebsiella pneumoniae]|nr:DMT family transporter [Klebsiella pneumoniae]
MRVIDYGRLLLLAALWGASFLFMRITTPAFGALNSAFLRVLFAAIALGLLLGVQGKWSGYQGKFTSTLQLGVINSGLPFLMYCLAAQWLPAGYSATLNATAPMMGVLIGALCFAEPLTLRKGGGAILGAIGVAVIARPTSGLSRPPARAGGGGRPGRGPRPRAGRRWGPGVWPRPTVEGVLPSVSASATGTAWVSRIS